jgi:hypothetical protein
MTIFYWAADMFLVVLLAAVLLFAWWSVDADVL